MITKLGLKEGLKAGASIVPTFVAIFAAFGVAAQVIDVPPWAALLMTVIVFAAPAQLAMIDVADEGAAFMQVLFVGILVNLRFLVMSLTLSHLFQGVGRCRLFIWAHFVAASSYLLTFFQARKTPELDAFAFYRGVVLIAFPAAVAGTVLGLVVGTALPNVLAFGATLFLPIYFALLLAGELKDRAEFVVVALAFILTPPLETLVPGWGIFIAAVGVGAAMTAAS